MAEPELDDVLEDFYADGTFDSSGQFSLRTDLAMEKLGEFQLEQPQAFLKNLFAAGYTAGGTHFSIKQGTFSTSLTFKNAQFLTTKTEDIQPYLLISPKNSQEWAMHELAIAIKAGLNVNVVKKITISETTVGTSFRVDYGLRKWLLVLKFGGYWSLVEAKVLREMLAYSPIPGRYRKWFASLTVDEEAILLNHNDVNHPLMHSEFHGGWVCVGENKGLGKAGESRITLIIRGRPFHRSLKLGAGKVQAVILGDQLRLDLAQKAPVQDEQYLDLIRRLAQQIDDMRHQWVREPGEYAGTRVERIMTRQVARSLRNQARLAEALVLEQKFENSGHQQACLLFQMGRQQEANKLLSDRLAFENPVGHELARQLLEVASIEGVLGRTRALDHWQQAFEILEKRYQGRRDHKLADCIEEKLEWLPLVKKAGQDFSDLVEEMLTLKQGLGAEHARQASSLEMAASMALDQPKKALEKALSRAQQAYEIRKTTKGPGDAELGRSLAVLALVSHKLKNGQAESYANRRLSLMTTIYGPLHPEVGASHNLLSLVTVDGDRGMYLEEAKLIADHHRLPLDDEQGLIVCFRGWFHSRAPWTIRLPLRVSHDVPIRKSPKSAS